MTVIQQADSYVCVGACVCVSVCVWLQATQRWWQVRANSVRRLMKRGVEMGEKPLRRSCWGPKVERDRKSPFLPAEPMRRGDSSLGFRGRRGPKRSDLFRGRDDDQESGPQRDHLHGARQPRPDLSSTPDLRHEHAHTTGAEQQIPKRRYFLT